MSNSEQGTEIRRSISVECLVVDETGPKICPLADRQPEKCIYGTHCRCSVFIIGCYRDGSGLLSR